jgi:hypothetical protein
LFRTFFSIPYNAKEVNVENEKKQSRPSPMEQEESGFSKVQGNGQFAHRTSRSSIIDFKTAITQDIAELELALSILNGLRDVNLERLKLLDEAEKRKMPGD